MHARLTVISQRAKRSANKCLQVYSALITKYIQTINKLTNHSHSSPINCHSPSRVLSKMTFETVEYNAAKDLLIVRHPKLTGQDENVLLGKAGWIEIPLKEVQDILPPTPGMPRESSWLNLTRSNSSDSDRDDSRAVTATAGSGSRKRVYKRAPVASGLHFSCEE